jgi:hypothetical protein
MKPYRSEMFDMTQAAVMKAAVCLLMASGLVHCQTITRGRDEGTMNIPASNVMGNGNIDCYIASAARYSLGGFAVDPIIGAQIGISDMMQLSGQFIPLAKNGLGPIEAHLQITTATTSCGSSERLCGPIFFFRAFKTR